MRTLNDHLTKITTLVQTLKKMINGCQENSDVYIITPLQSLHSFALFCIVVCSLSNVVLSFVNDKAKDKGDFLRVVCELHSTAKVHV